MNSPAYRNILGLLQLRQKGVQLLQLPPTWITGSRTQCSRERMPNSQALRWHCLSESWLLIQAAANASSSYCAPRWHSWCLTSNSLLSKTEKILLKQSLRRALMKLVPDCKACFRLTVVIKERTELCLCPCQSRGHCSKSSKRLWELELKEAPRDR